MQHSRPTPSSAGPYCHQTRLRLYPVQETSQREATWTQKDADVHGFAQPHMGIIRGALYFVGWDQVIDRTTRRMAGSESLGSSVEQLLEAGLLSMLLSYGVYGGDTRPLVQA